MMYINASWNMQVFIMIRNMEQIEKREGYLLY